MSGGRSLKFDLGGLRPPPQPAPGQGAKRIEIVRALRPGGEMVGYVQTDQMLYLEQMYRKLPPEGLFDASPSAPVTFAMGSFRVPQDQVLVVLDYAFDIYRFSGLAAGDFVPIEPNGLSTQVGWDLVVDGNSRPNQSLQFQLVPQIQTQTQQTFSQGNPGSQAQAWQFEQARALKNQGPAGAALSLMPQRRHRPGLMHVASNYIVQSNSVFSINCSVFNHIPIPIGFFEANFCGLLFPKSLYDAYYAANKATGDAMVPPAPGSDP